MTAYAGNGRVAMPLLWAQRGHWTIYRQLPERAQNRGNEQVSLPLPEGTTLAQVVEAVRTLVAKHQIFRTIYRIGATGQVEQVVLPDAELDLTTHDMTGTDPAAAHAALLTRLRDARTDLSTAPPVRFGVLIDDGRPCLLILVVHHIAVDAAAFAAVQKDLAAILAVLGPAGDPPDDAGERTRRGLPLRVEPSAQVAFQTSGPGRRQHERTMAYWRDLVERFPATVLPIAGGSGARQRTRTATLVATAGSMTVELARRYGAPESIVILAAVLAVLSRRTGNTRTVASVSSANRFEPELLNFVGNLAQEVAVEFVPPLDGSVRELVAAVKRQMTPVYRHGGFDSDEVFTLLRRRQFTHGTLLKRAVCYNYKNRSGYAPPAFHCPPGGAVTTEDARMPYYYSFGIGVHRLGDRLILLAHYDAPLFEDEFAAGVLTAVDGFLVDAATAEDDLTVAELLDDAVGPAPALAGRWLVRDGCRVSLDASERMLVEHPSVTAARMVTDDAGGGIVAYAAGDRIDPYALRRHASTRLQHWPAAVIPDRFVVLAQPPPSPAADDASWAASPVAVAGDGRAGPLFDDDSPPARALRSALAEVHPGVDWSHAASYLTGGGDIGHIDAVLNALDERGASGLTYRDLYDITPPSELFPKIQIN